MLSIRSSNSSDRNPDFIRVPREQDENNLAWLLRNLSAPAGPSLILLGGVDPLNFRLRTAQSHARRTLTPSHWSHVALLLPGKSQKKVPQVYEISLQPPAGFGFPPITNGVQMAAFDRYDDRKQWPNIAAIQLPFKTGELEQALLKFRRQRSAIDAVELVVAWLAFVWGVGRSSNPLLDGLGIPSATMAQYVLAAMHYELTPGLDSRSSCPEAIWQAAMWWHTYYEQTERTKLTGRWVVDHGLVDDPEYVAAEEQRKKK